MHLVSNRPLTTGFEPTKLLGHSLPCGPDRATRDESTWAPVHVSWIYAAASILLLFTANAVNRVTSPQNQAIFHHRGRGHA